MTMKFKPKGEMNEKALIDVAALLMPEFEWISQKRFYYDPNNKRRFFKVDCVSMNARIVIEYEGPNHYTDVWRNQRDNKRLKYFEGLGFRFLRWPYYCQLTQAVASHFFGNHDYAAYLTCISNIYGTDSEDQILACGFHTTKNTPSNFTYLGVDRFIAELSELPIVVKSQVAETLRRYCRDEDNSNMVIGEDERLHDLLKFYGVPLDLRAFYSRPK